MSLNDSIHYVADKLQIDFVSAAKIIKEAGSPVYVYSLRRIVNNLTRLRDAFAPLRPHIHYSLKANANLALLRALIMENVGLDVVSAGEIHKALAAGADPNKIVFAGVGKTADEIRYALDQGVGWFNVENVDELRIINDIAASLWRDDVPIALRFNPDVTANTHPYIATGHGAAKFGLTADVIRYILLHRDEYPHLSIHGIHMHIGSNLKDTQATKQAVQEALELMRPHKDLQTLNIGGGFPVSYLGEAVPDLREFAQVLAPLLQDYRVLLEPGRSIVADAGVLLTKVLYVKRQAGECIVIVDASMTELLRPALYQASHRILPITQADWYREPTQVVGPVCETTDVLGRNVLLPPLQAGDALAILTAGAYGMVMASNYNARPRPAEVVVDMSGRRWQITRQRETWADLLRGEE
jgi:diaminopimelate decarboxylase